MPYEIAWKKRVFETHEVQVLVRAKTPSAWDYTVRVCRPGTNIRAASTLVESAKPAEQYSTPEAAEAAGFVHGKEMAERLP
ncbi:hypothetical protein AB4Z48_25120 [Cupriavidus sp. 2TAF22]|uniref:hypothetical protein n=1 Tax=unclassified Cupriavidus TaxID=2640874 RepID=UPI003F8FE2A9